MKDLVTGGATGVVKSSVLGGTTLAVKSRMVDKLSSIVMVGGGGNVKSSVVILEVSDPAAGRLLREGVGIMRPAGQVEELASGS